MRHIGNLPDEKAARFFADFLVAKKIRNQMDADADGSWQVWIVEEDHVPEAQAALGRFQADPQAAEFDGVAAGAAKARAEEAAELAAYQQRVRTRRSLFPKFGGHGIGVLTYALIFACLIVAYYSDMGKNDDFLRRMFISDPVEGRGHFLPEVFSGEVWRLWTPLFVHLGLAHIVFNMLWLFQLGGMIEGRQGANYLACLVAVTGLVSNLAQYYLHGPSFGGMSGVVYALAGYAWIRGKYDRSSGVGLDPQSITYMLIWLVVCYTGFVGPIANTAHVVGLLSGMAWGRIAAYLAMRRPE